MEVLNNHLKITNNDYITVFQQSTSTLLGKAQQSTKFSQWFTRHRSPSTNNQRHHTHTDRRKQDPCCNRRGIFLHQHHGVSHNHTKGLTKNSIIFWPAQLLVYVNVKCYLRRATGKQVANNVRLLNQSFTHISQSVNKRRCSLAARRMNPFSRPSPKRGRW